MEQPQRSPRTPRPPWSRQVAADIGKRVALYREKQKITAKELAERCSHLGLPSLNRLVITKLENGHRESVSTAELQVLADALGVPAIVLLFGLGTSEAVEVLPDAPVEPYDAVRWFTGEIAEPGSEDPPLGNPMNLYGLHHALVSRWQEEQQARAAALRAIRTARTPGEKQEAEELADLPVTLADGNTQHLRTIRATMRTLGYVLPRLPAEIARALGEEAPDGIH